MDFESLDDFFKSINLDIPRISKLDLKPIIDKAQNGWVDKIIL